MSSPRDITGRLRARARLYQQHGAVSTADVLYEAATEIERLRTQVRMNNLEGKEAPPLPTPRSASERSTTYREFIEKLLAWRGTKT